MEYFTAYAVITCSLYNLVACEISNTVVVTGIQQNCHQEEQVNVKTAGLGKVGIRMLVKVGLTTATHARWHIRQAKTQIRLHKSRSSLVAVWILQHI